MGFAIGVVVGFIGAAVMAHFKPEWFNKAVQVVDKVDTKA